MAGIHLSSDDLNLTQPGGWAVAGLVIVSALSHKFGLISKKTSKDVDAAGKEIISDYETRDGQNDGGRRK